MHKYDVECECEVCQKSWRVEHIWETFNSQAVADWTFSGDTEDEVVSAAYGRKEKLRPTEEEWTAVEDKFTLYKKNVFLGEFSL
jgi:glycyl-tRNA synthetase (class II)